ncbi:MAG: C-GCAxxG-C-C family protein [Bryobacteraceae bacterium]
MEPDSVADAVAAAEARFRQGYSCSQAVFSVLGELWGIPKPVSLRVAAGFGGGLARTAGVCGAVTGAIMALGLAQPSVSPDDNRVEKEKTYQRCRRFLRLFEQRHGSVICRDLVGCDLSTPEGLAEAHSTNLTAQRCPPYVRSAVELALELLAQEGVQPRPLA